MNSNNIAKKIRRKKSISSDRIFRSAVPKITFIKIQLESVGVNLDKKGLSEISFKVKSTENPEHRQFPRLCNSVKPDGSSSRFSAIDIKSLPRETSFAWNGLYRKIGDVGERFRKGCVLKRQENRPVQSNILRNHLTRSSYRATDR